MRQNLPVTHVEFDYDGNDMLVSKTDLDSHITYCNPAFIAVSGYAESELIGQPHNLIRHPDMPAEAFRDMWATLRSGQPWSGLVKNRRKDGSHYWVMANVTPVLDQGRPVGFMSVRTKPTRAEVNAAEALYALMRNAAQAGRTGPRLSQGKVVLAGMRGRVQAWFNFGLMGKLMLVISAITVAPYAHTLIPVDGGLGQAIDAGLALALAAASLRWLHRSVVQPMQALSQSANRIAAGDLAQSTRVTRNDDVGQLERALNQLNVNLRAVVCDVRNGVAAIHHATEEIAQGNTDLSQRTETQAASVQQTASSMSDLSSTIGQSAQTANEAARLSLEASQVAQSGGQEMAKMTSTMDAIEASSKRVAEFSQVIEGIAFQTNILALNAAVEAARAGEQGRGFNVVAGEVRALAGRAAAAAGEIRQLIEASIDSVESGKRTALSAGAVIDRASDSARRVSELLQEINDAVQNQSGTVQHVGVEVTQLESMTQQNAALVEEAAAASMSLRTQASQLENTVQIFKL
jgi:aerotaxis receptor